MSVPDIDSILKPSKYAHWTGQPGRRFIPKCPSAVVCIGAFVFWASWFGFLFTMAGIAAFQSLHSAPTAPITSDIDLGMALVVSAIIVFGITMNSLPFVDWRQRREPQQPHITVAKTVFGVGHALWCPIERVLPKFSLGRVRPTPPIRFGQTLQHSSLAEQKGRTTDLASRLLSWLLIAGKAPRKRPSGGLRKPLADRQDQRNRNRYEH